MYSYLEGGPLDGQANTIKYPIEETRIEETGGELLPEPHDNASGIVTRHIYEFDRIEPDDVDPDGRAVYVWSQSMPW